jgi:two-component system chemotaxis response regulator CheB
VSRELLRDYLMQDPCIEVVAEACNGQEAVELASRLSPHVITMDLQMPVMDGMRAIETIMTTKAIPILVVSSVADADSAYDALLRGALDVINKPDFSSEEAKQLPYKVRLLAGVSVVTRRGSGNVLPSCHAHPVPHPNCQHRDGFDRVFAIACSTGGPQALASLLPALPEDFASPIVIVQHIAQGFSQGMADWLNKLTQLTVSLPQAGERLQAGVVYLAPSEHNLVVDEQKRLQFVPHEAKEIYHPNCYKLLTSLAQVFGQRCVGIILTGMGKDGVRGIRDIYAQKGITLAQDEASSLIYGMNRAAIDAGCICEVIPLSALADRMLALT